MILQALYDYHRRKSRDGAIAPDGFTQQPIDFLIVLDSRGRFVSLDCLQEMKGKRKIGQALQVPAIGRQSEKHDASGNDANLLWDKSEFVLGVGKKGRAKLQSFISTIEDYFPTRPDDIQIVLGFLKRGNHDQTIFSPILDHPEFGEEIRRGSVKLSFKLSGRNVPLCCESFVKPAIQGHSDKDELHGPCLITGKDKVPIEITHPVVKKVRGTQTSGANIVSFNHEAFCSHGWKQSQNAPVWKHAAAAYAKSLSNLVSSDTNSIRIGDTTTVFWSKMDMLGTSYDLETDFRWFFADPPQDELDRGVRAIRALYEALYTGRVPVDEGNKFYVLGLAPNAARIAVRFWKVGTVAEFAERIKRHFDDLEIVRGPKDPDYLTLNQLLRSTAFESKMDNVPPNLAGAVVDSVLDGTPYPVTLAHQCIRRIRAERRVTRTRAAILKAYLNRLNLHDNSLRKEEMTVSLDRDNTSPGYRLGRLFAVLEKIQEEANRGINATIRDRFYGAASSIPVAVFPQLLKLKNHHLAKLDNPGRKVNLEKEIGEIFCGIKDFPSHLSMEEQARFSIGYYHQRQSFFEK